MKNLKEFKVYIKKADVEWGDEIDIDCEGQPSFIKIGFISR